MSNSVLYMSMSLDGFITGPDDDVSQGLGSGGERLHDWLGDVDEELPHFHPPGPSGEIFDELMATGAVLVGRRTFDHADHWDGDHHGVPIFVPTRGESPAPASDLVHTTSPTGSRARCARPSRRRATRTCWSTAPTWRSRACARACSTSSKCT